MRIQKQPDMGIRTARRHVCDVPPTARDRVAAALVPQLRGPEAVTWTTDMAQLFREEAVEPPERMTQVLVAATLADRSHPTQRQP